MSEKIVIDSGAADAAAFVLEESAVVVGSAAECRIRVQDASALPRHAMLEKVRGQWRLRALDAARPIESGGRLMAELRLDHGCSFRIGQTQMRFVTTHATIQAARTTDTTEVNVEQAADELSRARDKIMVEVGRIIIGQKDVISQVLTALFSGGHCLLIGAPGLAKTLMVRTLAGALDLDSRRIQFTPDLMPADITGTDILEEDPVSGRRSFRFSRGPVFTNMLLADEINRTPPKTQAALLEAMQEQRVTASGITYDLPQPFLVLATQNPIELEGTYPLPEAQLDRFMFSIRVDYPSRDEEPEILLSTTRDRAWEVERVLDAAAILRFQQLVRQVPVSPHIARYAAALARATRPDDADAPDYVKRWVRWGAGPRAGQYLLLSAKAHAILHGAFNIGCEDVRRYALPVLRHRIFLNFAAASEGVSTDDLVKRLLGDVKEPEYT